ncbi:MAG TPA: ATP-binding cassette domain-containing protein [Parvularculaceae bacterium]|nr:ATP-binding cassette domain-containing protein [Parvularculaceae bacterium]
MTAGPILIADEIDLTLKSKAGPIDILREVSLSVAPGESVGVVGRSGSGKSSLLSVLAGLERPSAGRVIAAGIDLGALGEDALARFRLDHIGFVFQAFHLIPTMTALENAALPLEFAGKKDAFERARAMLSGVGLGERLDHYPDQLSGGEQQRVALVRALVASPPILLADEPTGNLDAASAAMVADLLFQLAREAGAALVLVSHDEALAARCSRIVLMEDGRLFDRAAAQAAQ